MNTEENGLRIGVTMRVAEASSYRETRDLLARDWGKFLAAALPSVPWMPIPNRENDVHTIVRDWGLNGFILTGGDDWGTTPVRDRTEETILQIAEENSFPLLGVCRGLQAMQIRSGGRLAACPCDAHVATQHTVRFVRPVGGSRFGDGEMTVNSFHANGILEGELADDLEAIAISADGFIEAASHGRYPQLGVMWHPERARAFHPTDVGLLRSLFGFKETP